ncbi:hypothetical protein Micbo1qcDRAFT_226707, partial [Microdochium bolleyi]
MNIYIQGTWRKSETWRKRESPYRPLHIRPPSCPPTPAWLPPTATAAACRDLAGDLPPIVAQLRHGVVDLLAPIVVPREPVLVVAGPVVALLLLLLPIVPPRGPARLCDCPVTTTAAATTSTGSVGAAHLSHECQPAQPPVRRLLLLLTMILVAVGWRRPSSTAVTDALCKSLDVLRALVKSPATPPPAEAIAQRDRRGYEEQQDDAHGDADGELDWWCLLAVVPAERGVYGDDWGGGRCEGGGDLGSESGVCVDVVACALPDVQKRSVACSLCSTAWLENGH